MEIDCMKTQIKLEIICFGRSSNCHMASLIEELKIWLKLFLVSAKIITDLIKDSLEEVVLGLCQIELRFKLIEDCIIWSFIGDC